MTLRQLIEDVTAQIGYARAGGVEVGSVEPGRVELSLRRKPELLQLNGFFHGGAVAGLADHAAAAAAATTTLPEGKIVVTADLYIAYPAPADGNRLIARGRMLRAGSTLYVAAAEVAAVRDSAETPCAVATATLRVVDMPPAG